jgi:DNA-binding NarL/FixJ family response regulator
VAASYVTGTVSWSDSVESSNRLTVAVVNSTSVTVAVHFGFGHDPAGADGAYEICREFRERHGEDLAIIFVSATRTDETDRVAGLLLGADDYLPKPIPLDHLLARVRRLVGHSATIAPFVAERLTPREQEVLGLLAAGLEQDEIAHRLVITSKTVAKHIERILSKLGVRSRSQAVVLALRDHSLEA